MASILDVFNASARVASQGLDMFSRIRKEEADTDLQKKQLKILRESQLFLDNLETDGDVDHYLDKWNQFNKDLQTNENKNLSGVQQSPYYQQRLNEMLAQNNVRFESAVRGKQIQRVHQTIRVNEIEALDEIKELYKDDPQGMINAANEVLQRGLKNRTFSPDEYTKMKKYYWDAATSGVIDRAVWDAFSQGKTYDDIDSIIDGIDLSGITDTRTNPLRKDGQTEGYDDDPEWLAHKRDAAKQAGKERSKQTWNTYVTGKRKENENTVSKTYGQTLTGVTMGTASRDDILRGIAEVYSFKDPFFDPDERDTYVRWYNDLLKALDKDPDAAKETALLGWARTNTGTLIRAVISGELDVSPHDLYNTLGETLYASAVMQGKINETFPEEKFGLLVRPALAEFYDTYVKIYQGEDGKQGLGHIGAMNTMMELIDEDNEYTNKPFVKKMVINQMIDMTASRRWRYLSEDEVLQNAKDFADSIRGIGLDELLKYRVGLENDQTWFAKVSKQVFESEYLKTTSYNRPIQGGKNTPYDGREIVLPGMGENLNKYYAKEQSEIERITKKHNLMPKDVSDPAQYTTYARREYRDLDTGDLYRIKSDGEEYWVEINRGSTVDGQKMFRGEDWTEWTGEQGKPGLMIDDANKAAERNTSQNMRTHRNQEVDKQREANGLANMMYKGENLPLPNLTGRDADDPMAREEAILRYGIEAYTDWLRRTHSKIYTNVFRD
ncbi:MAG: hypothetical protein LBL19_08505 [Spirochaetaceae bacterium]|jgi:hypothetical protein|nr:hypothetical protein [Spirochaetaceae bacterium]